MNAPDTKNPGTNDPSTWAIEVLEDTLLTDPLLAAPHKDELIDALRCRVLEACMRIEHRHLRTRQTDSFDRFISELTTFAAWFEPLRDFGAWQSTNRDTWLRFCRRTTPDQWDRFVQSKGKNVPYAFRESPASLEEHLETCPFCSLGLRQARARARRESPLVGDLLTEQFITEVAGPALLASAIPEHWVSAACPRTNPLEACSFQIDLDRGLRENGIMYVPAAIENRSDSSRSVEVYVVVEFQTPDHESPEREVVFPHDGCDRNPYVTIQPRESESIELHIPRRPGPVVLRYALYPPDPMRRQWCEPCDAEQDMAHLDADAPEPEYGRVTLRPSKLLRDADEPPSATVGAISFEWT